MAGLWTFISGDLPQFGNLIVNGNPCISNPTPQHWFNTTAFSNIPANTYVLRTNPLQYSCLTGPHFWNVDANLTKAFIIIIIGSLLPCCGRSPRLELAALVPGVHRGRPRRSRPPPSS